MWTSRDIIQFLVKPVFYRKRSVFRICNFLSVCLFHFNENSRQIAKWISPLTLCSVFTLVASAWYLFFFLCILNALLCEIRCWNFDPILLVQFCFVELGERKFHFRIFFRGFRLLRILLCSSHSISLYWCCCLVYVILLYGNIYLCTFDMLTVPEKHNITMQYIQENWKELLTHSDTSTAQSRTHRTDRKQKRREWRNVLYFVSLKRNVYGFTSMFSRAFSFVLPIQS